MIHRLMNLETTRYWQDEPPGIDPRRVPRRARARVKKAEKVLRRFKVWPRRKITSRKWVEFDGRNLLEGIIENIRDVEALYRGRVERVLVGPDQFPRLKDAINEKLGPYGFTEQIKLVGPDGMKVCGVRIQVVPWMRGVLLVPKDNQ